MISIESDIRMLEELSDGLGRSVRGQCLVDG